MPAARQKKRKIAITTTSRAEYGYFLPIIREIEKNPSLDYGVIATDMHVLDRFGHSVDEMKKDRVKIAGSVFNTFDGYTHLTMVKSLSVFMLQLPEILDHMGADMLLVNGDRGAQLMAAIVGAYLYKPVAHVQSGEISGNIDGVSRHAITRFAHIHFASNKDAATRVRKMGEEPFRIFTVGAPQLDDFLAGNITSPKILYKKYNLDPKKKTILLMRHSVTEDFDKTEKHMAQTLEAVAHFHDANILVFMNNSDAGSTLLHRAIEHHRTPTMRIFPNVPRADFGGLMSIASVLVGNSSSGILEAPTFKLPAVNIGRRELGRLQGINVINAKEETADIIRGIRKALSNEFQAKMKKCVNPYGDGKSSKRIVETLATIPIDEKLLIKRITY